MKPIQIASVGFVTFQVGVLIGRSKLPEAAKAVIAFCVLLAQLVSFILL